MLQFLDTIFKNFFAKEEAQNTYHKLCQGYSEDFNTFYSEFSWLASIGEVPLIILQGDLYQKLNTTFQDQLLTMEH